MGSVAKFFTLDNILRTAVRAVTLPVQGPIAVAKTAYGAVENTDFGNSVSQTWQDVTGRTARAKADEAAIIQGEKQDQLIDYQMNKENERDKQEKEIKNTQQADLQRDQSKTRQKQIAAAGQSYRDTILTSPLGLSDRAPTKRKTLLGL